MLGPAYEFCSLETARPPAKVRDRCRGLCDPGPYVGHLGLAGSLHKVLRKPEREKHIKWMTTPGSSGFFFVWKKATCSSRKSARPCG